MFFTNDTIIEYNRTTRHAIEGSAMISHHGSLQFELNFELSLAGSNPRRNIRHVRKQLPLT